MDYPENFSSTFTPYSSTWFKLPHGVNMSLLVMPSCTKPSVFFQRNNNIRRLCFCIMPCCIQILRMQFIIIPGSSCNIRTRYAVCFLNPNTHSTPTPHQLHQHIYSYKADGLQVIRSVVPRVCSVDPLSTMSYSQRICGYIL